MMPANGRVIENDFEIVGPADPNRRFAFPGPAMELMAGALETNARWSHSVTPFFRAQNGHDGQPCVFCCSDRTARLLKAAANLVWRPRKGKRFHGCWHTISRLNVEAGEERAIDDKKDQISGLPRGSEGNG